MHPMLLVLAALGLIAYLLVGAILTERGMRFMRANALNDLDYFGMAVQDARPSLSTIMPKIGVTLLWPLVMLYVIAGLLVSACRSALAASI